MTTALFRKYLEEKCDPAETRTVEEWLHTQSPAAMDEVLLTLWKDAHPVMPEADERLLWQQLQRLQQETSVVPATGVLSATGPTRTTAAIIPMQTAKRLAAAAVVLILVAAGAILFTGRKPATSPAGAAQTPVAGPSVLQWTTVSNDGPARKRLMLEDGTEVTLAPHSKIKYPSAVERTRRSVYLNGKALFRVAKVSDRPFTVYSGNIATTALGTVFLVSMDSVRLSVNVQLYQGRVVVRPFGGGGTWTGSYLSVGQQLLYDDRKMTAEVSRQDEPDDTTAGHRRSDPNALQFVNTPLADVFDQLMTHYHQPIYFNRSDLIHLDFTGTLNGTDSLSTLLGVMANMNGLIITANEKGFLVHRSSR